MCVPLCIEFTNDDFISQSPQTEVNLPNNSEFLFLHRENQYSWTHKHTCIHTKSLLFANRQVKVLFNLSISYTSTLCVCG